MPDYIGVAATLIATNYANNYSYRNYVFKDEMIREAVLFCIKAVYSYDHKRFDNPFTYFTRAVSFGFWDTIRIEKEQLYTKYKMIDKASVYNEMYDGDAMGAENADSPFSDGSTSNRQHFIKDFEEKLVEKKEKDIQKKLEKSKDLADILKPDDDEITT
jgi:hypothetical protein